MTKTTLKNGVRLILIPMKGVASVATAVFAGVGSRYETPEINGVSHFLEHMVFKGTAKYPTTDDVNVIERIGGIQNAYTDIDVTKYHNKVLSTDWARALDINTELALKPLLLQEHVDKERDVILEEMKRYEDEPAAKVEETMHTMLYPGTRLGMRIIGEEKSLRAVASKELREYHDRWYRPDRLVVVLAGDISRQSSAIRGQVEKWYGDLAAKAPQDREIAPDGQTEPRVAVVTKPDASQAHLVVGVRTYARTSEDRFAWNVFNFIMGISFSSRLFREIREKRGLCYHIRSSSDNWRDVGNWTIYAGVATQKVEEALKAIMAELAKAHDGGVTDDEVAVAQKRIVTMLAFKTEDPEFLAEYYGRREVYGEDEISIEDYIKRIKKVTKHDINKLSKKYLVEKTLNLALVWNKQHDDKLVKLLSL
jgi:predicted Zn-dependent peptidase